MLVAYDAFSQDSITIDANDFNKPSMIFVNTFKSILNSIASGKKGDVLEALGTSWLIARLVASRLNGKATISSERLLGIHSTLERPEIREIATPKLYLQSSFVHDEDRLPSICNSAESFATPCNEKVVVSAEHPCQVYLSSSDQQYDLMIVSLVDNKPFTLFIDLKSKNVSKLHEGKLIKAYSVKFNQFEYVEELKNLGTIV